MGHLARQAAVALALRGTAEPLLFSLSTALPVVAAEHRLRGEYCPGAQRGWMPHPLWHGYLRDRIGAMLTETGARMLVFDGVFPYLGLLRARVEHPDVGFCWIRRGMWRPSVGERALAARPFFDLVVEPGDIAADADAGITAGLDDATRVGPVTLLEPTELMPRAEAAALLGLDPSRPAALVMLDAGRAGDVATPRAAAIQTFLTDPDWQVAVTFSWPGRVAGSRPVAATSAEAVRRQPSRLDSGSSRLRETSTPGLGGKDAGRVHELVDVYPLARYLNAFDVAVSAAGYNAVHELLLSRTPTLLVPNRSTTTDDQVARSRWSADVGLALYAEADAAAVTDGVKHLLDSYVRARLTEMCATLPPPTGATEVAALLAPLAGSFANHRSSVTEHVHAQDLALRDVAMRGIGASGTEFVRRLLRRNPTRAPMRRLAVEPVVTDRLDRDMLRGSRPVEHLLSETSEQYRERRLEIARRCYRWP